MIIETWFEQDLMKPVQVQYINGNVFSQDNMGNRIGVKLYKDGVAQGSEGTISASVIRADGATLAVTGSSSGNAAWVDLPQAAYAVPGLLTIVIKSTVSSAVTTICAALATVYRSSTDSIVDPGTIIPSIADLIAQIQAAVASIPADYSSLWTSLAPAYSTSATYAVGDYVTYNGGLYRCIVDIASGETWTAAHWQSITAGEGITDIGTEIKKNTESMTGLIPIPMVKNRFINLSGTSVTMVDGVPAYTNTSSSYDCGMMQCSAGDAFTFNVYGGSQTRAFGFIDSSGNILLASAASVKRTNYVIYAPENSAWVIIHTRDKMVSYKGVNYGKMLAYNTSEALGFFVHPSGTYSGVTYTWNGNVCSVNGTATGESYNYLLLYSNAEQQPVIEAGAKYAIRFKQKSANMALSFVWHYADASKTYDHFYSDGELIAPVNFASVTIALHVVNGVTVSNDSVEVYMFKYTDVEREIDSKVDAIIEALPGIIPVNILPDFATFHDVTVSGITFSWDEYNPGSCVVTGTATATAATRLWSISDGFPPQVEPGTEYQLIFSSSNTSAVQVVVYMHDGSTGVTSSTIYTTDAVISFAPECDGFNISLYVPEGADCGNGVDVVIKLSTMDNGQGGGSAGEGGNPNVNMFFIGSSFMLGSIYPNGVQAPNDYENTPYGNIAISLGIKKDNIKKVPVGYTGILKPSTNTGSAYYGKSILDILLETNLSKYDYVLTEYNLPDIGDEKGLSPGYPLGNLNSTAGDGTIVGAFLQLIAYMKTQNPNATLIVVGAPPSSAWEGHYGDVVFTALYNQGYSIHDADIMLHRLAVREHFIFIDWEDLNLSYYYRSLCYGNNGHPQSGKTTRAMGLYLARQCNYTTSQTKVLAADANA